MTDLKSLIFGLVNFLILVVLFRWVFGPAANQFFYSRRMRIRKQMLTSVMVLRQARGRLAKSQENYEKLSSDIAARKKSIEQNSKKECDTIIKEAKMRSEHILEVGAKQAAEERNRHALLVRTRLLREAFKIVDERIKDLDTEPVQMHLMDKGLKELSGVSITEDEVPRR